MVRGSLKLDFYDNEKLHGEFESLRTRLIFGSCVVRSGVMRSLLHKIFEHTVQACLSEGDLANALTVVTSEHGRIGIGVINGQPLTAETLAVFHSQLTSTCQTLKLSAVALVAGDSMYVGVPWTAQLRESELSSRISTLALLKS